MPEPAPPADRTTVKDAFDSLATSISSEDAQEFRSTTLQDVRTAAQAIERQQAQRKSLRNLRRIEPFLRFLESYEPVIQVGCQGFSPMTWVWGPLKMMLQLASQYLDIFEKLIEAYAQIAEELPRIDRLQATFKDNEGFQKTLGLLYVDIIEFHKRAYKFFRRRAWYMFFDSTWKAFQNRFQGILVNLRRHTDLLDKEAASIHFSDAKRMADQTLQEVDDRERRRCASELREVFSWLSPDPYQGQRLDKLSRDCQADTCEWLLRNDVISSWIHEGASRPVVWLNGIPGSGKSVLCRSLVDYLERQQTTAFATYFCTYSPAGSDTATLILRTIAAQLVRSDPELLTYIHQNYVEKIISPSNKVMKDLLTRVLASLQNCRVVIDGVDECEELQQREILSSILSLQKESISSCKLLIASRDEMQIKRVLRQSTSISLKGKTDNAIALFISRGISDLRQAFDSLDEGFVNRMQRQLASKAGGMFLWVRLVLDDLQGQTTIQELEEALERLPEGLQEAYNRILERIRSRLSSSQRDQALRLLRWISCSFRPLKLTELREGIAFRPENPRPDRRNMILRNVVELCGPLIEEIPGGMIDVVHFSAKAYLIDRSSGPFIDHCLAHQQIAFSCITYLNSNLDFIPSAVDQKTRNVSETLIINRYNGLHHYANNFWIDHVLAYSRAGGKINNCKYLVQAFKQLLNLWRRKEESSITTAPSETIFRGQENQENSGLSVCCEDACLSDMLEHFAGFRKKLHTKENTFESPELRMKWERDSDPTYLSHIQAQVSSIIQDILQIPETNVPEHITVDALHHFKEAYKDLGITCRYSTCRFRANVFHSEKDRDSHESSHVLAYKCPDCDFYARGFATKRSLRRHQETYHTSTEDFQLLEQDSPRRESDVNIPSSTQVLHNSDITPLTALQACHLQLYYLEKQRIARLASKSDKMSKS